jgi:hypothetical protein
LLANWFCLSMALASSAPDGHLRPVYVSIVATLRRAE